MERPSISRVVIPLIAEMSKQDNGAATWGDSRIPNRSSYHSMVRGLRLRIRQSMMYSLRASATVTSTTGIGSSVGIRGISSPARTPQDFWSSIPEISPWGRAGLGDREAGYRWQEPLSLLGSSKWASLDLGAGAGGGSRTLTGFEPRRILSPVRLPFRHSGTRVQYRYGR